jgi:hypothetical protein
MCQGPIDATDPRHQLILTLEDGGAVKPLQPPLKCVVALTTKWVLKHVAIERKGLVMLLDPSYVAW